MVIAVLDLSQITELQPSWLLALTTISVSSWFSFPWVVAGWRWSPSFSHSEQRLLPLLLHLDYIFIKLIEWSRLSMVWGWFWILISIYSWVAALSSTHYWSFSKYFLLFLVLVYSLFVIWLALNQITRLCKESYVNIKYKTEVPWYLSKVESYYIEYQNTS